MLSLLRVIGRTACIVLLIGAVAGVLYLLIGAGGPSGRAERGWPRDAASYEGRPDAAYYDRRFGHGRGRGREDGAPADGGRRGREEASVGRGIGGMLGTAAQVGAIGVCVVGLQRLSRRRRRPPDRTRK
jgi:hypothetical protein